MTTNSITGRREPPGFRVLQLAHKEQLGPRLTRVTLAGDELEGFEIEQPAASVRLLFPAPGTMDLIMPEWNGNEFLLEDGSRPIIRTFTPRAMSDRGLDVDVVIHDGGAASAWASSAKIGAPVALSGPGRGYELDDSATGYQLLGDETAIPAIAQLLEHIPALVPIEVHIEVGPDFGRVPLPDHPQAAVTWHDRSEAVPGDAILTALAGSGPAAGYLVWCAGEAAVMHRVRTYLFKEAGIPRSRATIRGYWKARK